MSNGGGSSSLIRYLTVFLTGVLTAGISGWVSYHAAVAANAAQYIRIVGSSQYSPAAKIMALSSMYKKKLIDPDILFDAAYELEDESRQRLTLQLFYLVGRAKDRLPTAPIGYVDRPIGSALKPVNGAYRIVGWAIDDRKVDFSKSSLRIGSLIFTGPERDRPRRDIEMLFPMFGNADDRLNSGFRFFVPVTQVRPDVHHVSVKVWDYDYHFREILSANLDFKSSKTHNVTSTAR